MSRSIRAMTVEALKRELAALSFEKQGELAAYLVRLRNSQDPEYKKVLLQRVEDSDKDHWLTPEQFEERLDQN